MSQAAAYTPIMATALRRMRVLLLVALLVSLTAGLSGYVESRPLCLRHTVEVRLVATSGLSDTGNFRVASTLPEHWTIEVSRPSGNPGLSASGAGWQVSHLRAQSPPGSTRSSWSAHGLLRTEASRGHGLERLLPAPLLLAVPSPYGADARPHYSRPPPSLV